MANNIRLANSWSMLGQILITGKYYNCIASICFIAKHQFAPYPSINLPHIETISGIFAVQLDLLALTSTLGVLEATTRHNSWLCDIQRSHQNSALYSLLLQRVQLATSASADQSLESFGTGFRGRCMFWRVGLRMH